MSINYCTYNYCNSNYLPVSANSMDKLTDILLFLFIYVNSLRVNGSQGPQKKGCSGKKILSPSIVEAVCLGLEQTLVAVESYNIAV